MATTTELNDVGGTVTRHTGGPIRLIHFTPANRRCWCWMLVCPIISLRGPQRTITGEVVDTGELGSCAWSNLPGAPDFATRAEALRWCELVPGLVVSSVELELIGAE